MNGPIHRVFRDSIIRKMGILVGGTAVAQLISIISVPILTRYYSPSAFGVLAVYGSIVAILTGVASLRYEFAIPLPDCDRRAADLVCLSISLLILSATAALLLLAFASKHPIGAIGPIWPYWWAVPIGIVATGLYTALRYWSVRQREYHAIARTGFYQAGTSSASQIVFGMAGLGPLGLILGQVIGQAAGIGHLYRTTVKVHRVFRDATPHEVVRVARRYAQFPLVSTWGVLMNNGGLYMPAIAFAALYGSEIAGYYALADRMIRAPLALLSNSAAQVYVAETAARARTAPASMLLLFGSMATRLFALGIIVALVATLAAPTLFAIALGADWEIAGEFAGSLAIAFALRMVARPLAQTLGILERHGLQLAWEGGRLLCIGSVFVIAYVLDWSAHGCVVAYSLAAGLSYVAAIFISWRALTSNAAVAHPSGSVGD